MLKNNIISLLFKVKRDVKIMSIRDIILFVSTESKTCIPVLQFIASSNLDEINIVRLDNEETRARVKHGSYAIGDVPTLFVISTLDKVLYFKSEQVMPWLMTYVKNKKVRADEYNRRQTVSATPVDYPEHGGTNYPARSGELPQSPDIADMERLRRKAEQVARGSGLYDGDEPRSGNQGAPQQPRRIYEPDFEGNAPPIRLKRDQTREQPRDQLRGKRRQQQEEPQQDDDSLQMIQDDTAAVHEPHYEPQYEPPPEEPHRPSRQRKLKKKKPKQRGETLSFEDAEPPARPPVEGLKMSQKNKERAKMTDIKAIAAKMEKDRQATLGYREEDLPRH